MKSTTELSARIRRVEYDEEEDLYEITLSGAIQGTLGIPKALLEDPPVVGADVAVALGARAPSPADEAASHIAGAEVAEQRAVDTYLQDRSAFSGSLGPHVHAGEQARRHAERAEELLNDAVDRARETGSEDGGAA